ncbi:Hypothetical_protein [Hexamita inflata]|uniref:Hypothetical_protein n=1 Tax=Hexamita inflata TaxID=28002 RepID=A0ABP1H779_9EUKA
MTEYKPAMFFLILKCTMKMANARFRVILEITEITSVNIINQDQIIFAVHFAYIKQLLLHYTQTRLGKLHIQYSKFDSILICLFIISCDYDINSIIVVQVTTHKIQIERFVSYLVFQFQFAYLFFAIIQQHSSENVRNHIQSEVAYLVWFMFDYTTQYFSQSQNNYEYKYSYTLILYTRQRELGCVFELSTNTLLINLCRYIQVTKCGLL